MNKPNVINPQIIVSYIEGETLPYYEIQYYDVDRKEYMIGYGSYELTFVKQWFDNDLNIIDKNIPITIEKQGKWWLEREPNGKPYCYHCTNCDIDGHFIGIHSGTDYCPNCGAKMDTSKIYEKSELDEII